MSDDKSDLTRICDLEEFVHEDDPEADTLFDNSNRPEDLENTEVSSKNIEDDFDDNQVEDSFDDNQVLRLT